MCRVSTTVLLLTWFLDRKHLYNLSLQNIAFVDYSEQWKSFIEALYISRTCPKIAYSVSLQNMKAKAVNSERRTVGVRHYPRYMRKASKTTRRGMASPLHTRPCPVRQQYQKCYMPPRQLRIRRKQCEAKLAASAHLDREVSLSGTPKSCAIPELRGRKKCGVLCCSGHACGAFSNTGTNNRRIPCII